MSSAQLPDDTRNSTSATMSWLAALSTTVAIGSTAVAQGFNIDIGPSCAPLSIYGAVTGQVGVWNVIPAWASGAPLADLSGNPTGATITCSPSGTHDFFGNCTAYPTSTNLFQDSQDLGAAAGTVFTWSVSGLANGDYRVTLYSSTLSPVSGNTSEFTLAGGALGAQVCVSPWPSYDYYGYGKSFVHDVTSVTTGTLSWTARAASNEAYFSGVQIEPVVPGEIRNFCYREPNSQGCLPSIYATGTASLSANTLRVKALDVINNKLGLLYWGPAPAETYTMFGYRCVSAPWTRTPVQDSGGNAPPNDCSGSYSFHWNAAYAAQFGFSPGDTVWCQYWSRDPQSSGTARLTDGLCITFGL